MKKGLCRLGLSSLISIDPRKEALYIEGIFVFTVVFCRSHVVLV